ncbi:MAG: hypothetical protein WA188_03780 [Terriglobales bacterium]
MGRNSINRARRHTKGFTLIATLLMLVLLSGMAIGLMMMVNTEGKVGGTDLQNNLAYHAAEGGIEQMYSNVSVLLQNVQVPTAAQICDAGLPTTNGPSILGVTWKQYSVMPGNGNASSCPSTLTGIANWGSLTAGPYQGLYAQVIPLNMTVTASMWGGQEVTMMRSAQIAAIPVFQFGAFCDADCSIFPGGGMTFAGPVHANGDFYPFVGAATLTFQGQVSAFGNIVRSQLPNTNTNLSGHSGTVYVPTSSSGGCSTPTTNCQAMAAVGTSYGDGSVTGGGSSTAQPAVNLNNPTWSTFSNTTTHDQIINGNYYVTGASTPPGTGAKKLSLPFVNGTNFPYEVIRQPPSGESPTSVLGSSREYNMAQIHVLLDDNPANLPGGSSDANNIRLANITGSGGTNSYGITMTAGNYPSGYPAGTYQLYFAAATNALPSAGTVFASSTAASNGADTPDWPYAPNVGTGAPIDSGSSASVAPTLAICPPASPPPQNGVPAGCPASPSSPYYVVNSTPPATSAAAVSAGTATWNLIDGYLRVEYLNNSGAWVGVTQEWLKLGFARGVTAPSSPGNNYPAAGTNPINPNAILLLQEPAERQTPSAFQAGLALPSSSSTLAQIGAGTAPLCVTQAGTPAKCTEWSAAPPLLTDSGATQWQFGTSSSPATQSVTQFNWYPINFYDPREGEPRDIDWSTVYGTTDNTCTTNGVMNAVEIDVGNLKRWLAGAIGTSGQRVNSSAQNGYVLYFSDRRGMLPNPNATSSHPANTKSGDSGLEDTVNSASVPGVPDGALETKMSNQTYSPEDDNENGVLDNWGAQNLGQAFYGTVASPNGNLNTIITGGTHPNPYGTVASGNTNRILYCGTTGRKNWVSGARHVLKLVDGSLGNLPLNPNPTVYNGVTYNGGFTVASENPVYVQGNYNSNATDTTWTTGTDAAGMAAAAVIADAVTLFSNSWDDRVSMLGTSGNTSPSHLGNRTASTTYYRVAIASGKNMTFTYPTTWPQAANADDIGTDGGIHNFLHLMENWGGTNEYYKGSLASLYYSTYNTGFYKCCVAVYTNGTRDFFFDTDFTSPYGLPPGTPMFKDIESLGYRQLFTPRTN